MIRCCSSSVRSSKSSGMRRSICSLPVGFGVFEDFLAAIAHAFQAAADCVNGRGHAALEQGHREADGAAAGGIVAGGGHRLILDVAGQLVVEVEFLAIEVEGGCADFAFGEKLVNFARVGMRER